MHIISPILNNMLTPVNRHLVMLLRKYFKQNKNKNRTKEKEKTNKQTKNLELDSGLNLAVPCAAVMLYDL